MPGPSLRAFILLAGMTSLLGTAAPSRTLTFEDRIKAQEAIERVYYSHQIGAMRVFEEAVPRVVLERKVRAYLQQSVALEQFWKTPVTSGLLQGEMARIVLETRIPGRLREIFSALGDDEFVISECLARQTLVNRLVRSFLSTDERIQGVARQRAELLYDELLSHSLDAREPHSKRIVLDIIQSQTNHRPMRPGEAPFAGFFEVDAAGFSRRRALAPQSVGGVSPITENSTGFSITVLLEDKPGKMRQAVYVVPKVNWEEWAELDPARWGGIEVDSVASADSGIPLPKTDSTSQVEFLQDSQNFDAGCLRQNSVWENIALDGSPEPRNNPAATWTGNRLLIWGGEYIKVFNTGAQYDPVLNTWSPISTVNAPAPRYLFNPVWTGDYFFIWGGTTGLDRFDTGGFYDPISDTWTATSMLNALSARVYHTAVWTGTEILVWGGEGLTQKYNSGARFDLASNAWTPMAALAAPTPRAAHTAFWTGSNMIVWGGFDLGLPMTNTGGLYDPGADAWTPMAITDAPNGRYGDAILWNGHEMIAWGGTGGNGTLLGNGGVFDPAQNQWQTMTLANAPSTRYIHSLVWTGDRLLVWGGSTLSAYNNTGARYDPVTDEWSTMSVSAAPTPRGYHTTVWTGNVMIVWGGVQSGSTILNTGGIYDPLADNWTATPTIGVPSPRWNHTASWTGSEMIIWGGNNLANDGGTLTVTTYLDLDDDGYTPCLGDCDDGNPSVLPGFPETCDGLDNNCDDIIDEGNPGGGAQCGISNVGQCRLGTSECSDGRVTCVGAVNSTPEICDGLDSDCDGNIDNVARTDDDGDSIDDACDNCPSVYNPGQEDTDQNSRGNVCDLTILNPLGGSLIDCRSGSPAPTVTWTPFVYDRFRVYIARDSAFTKQVTSGDTLLKTMSWTVPAKRWTKVCASGSPSLYLKILGVDLNVSKSNPSRKAFSDVVVGSVQR